MYKVECSHSHLHSRCGWKSPEPLLPIQTIYPASLPQFPLRKVTYYPSSSSESGRTQAYDSLDDDGKRWLSSPMGFCLVHLRNGYELSRFKQVVLAIRDDGICRKRKKRTSGSMVTVASSFISRTALPIGSFAVVKGIMVWLAKKWAVISFFLVPDFTLKTSVRLRTGQLDLSGKRCGSWGGKGGDSCAHVHSYTIARCSL